MPTASVSELVPPPCTILHEQRYPEQQFGRHKIFTDWRQIFVKVKDDATVIIVIFSSFLQQLLWI